jgi:hypothetical protein
MHEKFVSYNVYSGYLYTAAARLVLLQSGHSSLQSPSTFQTGACQVALTKRQSPQIDVLERYCILAARYFSFTGLAYWDVSGSRRCSHSGALLGLTAWHCYSGSCVGQLLHDGSSSDNIFV